MNERERRRRIEEMKREIERRGGVLHIDDRLPLAVTEQFLREVLDCPECRGDHGRTH